MQRLRQTHGFPAVIGLAQDLEVLLLLQDQPQSMAHDAVIVRQNHPDHTLSICGW